MRKILYAFGMFVLLVIIAGCSDDNNEASSTEKQYTITVSSAVEEDTSMYKGLLKFKETAEEKSEGRLKVEVFANGELHNSERDAIEATQSGDIDASLPATGPMVGFIDEFTAIQFPFIFDNVDEANNLLDGEIGHILEERMEEKGLKGLGWANTGMTQITNNKKPIETIDDFKGLKLRTMENDVHLDSFQALGANPQPYAFGEIYSALQQNVFDGIKTPAQLIKSSNIYEVQDYITFLDAAADTAILIMNKEKYDELPDELQKVVDEAGEDFSAKERELSEKMDKEAREFLTEELEANEMSDEVRQEIKKKLEPVMDKYEDKIGSELLDMIKNR